MDNRLSPNSNPTTDRVQGFFSYRQESAYRGTSSLGIQQTQQTRLQCLFTYRQESAYRGTSSLGIQQTQQTRVQDLFSYSHEGAYRGTTRLGIQKTGQTNNTHHTLTLPNLRNNNNKRKSFEILLRLFLVAATTILIGHLD